MQDEVRLSPLLELLPYGMYVEIRESTIGGSLITDFHNSSDERRRIENELVSPQVNAVRLNLIRGTELAFIVAVNLVV